MPIIAQDEVRILIKLKERSHTSHALSQAVPDLHSTLIGDVIGENDVEVTGVVGKQQTLQKTILEHPARPVVRRVDIFVALRIIELAGRGIHNAVGGYALAVINGRLVDGEARIFRHRRYILYEKVGSALRALTGYEIGHGPIAMRKLQMSIDPVVRSLRQLLSELAGAHHHLPIIAINRVPIDVDVVKLVVRPNLLQLPVRLNEKTRIPQTNVVDGLLVRRDVLGGQGRLCRIRSFLELIELKGFPCHLDVVLEVRPLYLKFIRIDRDGVDQRGKQHEPPYQ